jgi:ABC-2 type transport system ATP-binding protein
MDAVRIKNLKKTYSNGAAALKGIDLSVEDGDFFALLGPNGAGKTTLIGILTGIINATGGKAEIMGYDIEKDAAKARSLLGVVPQEFNFNVFEKALDVLVHQAGYYGVSRDCALIEARQLLSRFGLWEKRHQTVYALSGGMKRRLMIARALVHRPKILLLDEPTAGVDIELRRDMWAFLEELNRTGVTIILTTHYLEEAEKLCRTAAIIHKGEIIEHGSMREFISRPTSESFIFYLKEPVSSELLKALDHYGIVKKDETTIEAKLPAGASVSLFIRDLEERGAEVSSMRHASNRLENVYLGLITGEE